MSADDSAPAVWPLVAIALGVSGLGLAFVPYPAGLVAGVAGFIGVIAGIIALVRGRRARVLAVGGIALSVAALAVASVTAVTGLSREWPMDKTDYVLAHELDVRIGDFEASRLSVTLTNKRDVPATYSIAVGGFRGDGNDQIQAARALVTLAGGASQEVEMFSSVDEQIAARLQGADFRLIGAWSHIPELGA